MTKTIKKVKGSSGDIKLGDILEVDIKYDFDKNAPLGCYVLTDHIPSGMTYLSDPSSYGLSTNLRGMLHSEGQNIVKGCAYNSQWWKTYSSNSSVYFVRVSAVGKFLQEPAIIQSSIDPSVFQKTPEEYTEVGR